MKTKNVKEWMDEELKSGSDVGSKSTKENTTKNSNRSGRLGELISTFTRNGLRELPIGTEYCIFRKIDDKGRKIAVSFFLEDAILSVYTDGHAIYTPHPRGIGTH